MHVTESAIRADLLCEFVAGTGFGFPSGSRFQELKGPGSLQVILPALARQSAKKNAAAAMYAPMAALRRSRATTAASHCRCAHPTAGRRYDGGMVGVAVACGWRLGEVGRAVDGRVGVCSSGERLDGSRNDDWQWRSVSGGWRAESGHVVVAEEQTGARVLECEN